MIYDIAAKDLGEKIIAISELLSKKMTTWSTLDTRSSNVQRAGFVNKRDATDGLNIVVDVQIPDNEQPAVLRLWAISSEQNNEVELFNNIQLDFSVDTDQARLTLAKKETISRNDLTFLLHSKATHLKHLIVSDHAGVDPVSKAKLGERYDIQVAEPQSEAGDVHILEALNNSLRSLQATANSEASL